MNSSLLLETQASANSPEPLSLMFLFEQGLEYIRQERYIEGITLLTVVGEHLPPDQIHLVNLLAPLRQECAKYSHIQQTLQEMNDSFVEVYTEIKASIATLTTLRSRLLIETNSGYTLHRLGQTYHSLEQVPVEEDGANPTLYAVCFGPFELSYLGVSIALCSNRNAQALLRYLIAQTDHSATTDTLMALFWPEDPADVALHKLYVTVSILRRALQTGSNLQGKYILYKHGIYQLDPSVPLHSDVEEFLTLYKAGHNVTRDAAASYYERACSLYIRPFLLEDRYADWSFTQREQLRQTYLDMCSTLASYYLETRSFEVAARWTTAIIGEDSCDEAAHRQMMRIYTLVGRRNDALRQYQRCQQVLQTELNLQPMPETVSLYQAILCNELNQ